MTDNGYQLFLLKTILKTVHEARLELESLYIGEDLARTESWTCMT